MTALFRHKIRLLVLALLIAVSALAGRLQAQPVVPPASSSTPAVVTPPPMPELVSPVAQFRKLLALSPAERESRLTNRPPEIRRRILAKIQEYESMKPEERELRLRNTQLRWYLLSFMETPAAERTGQLATVPETDRQFVKDHLEQWDRLPADEQKEVLKYEKVMENLLGQDITNAITSKVIALAPTSAHSDNLDSFLKLPPGERLQMYASFQRFFELSEAEKQNTLGALPSAERMQMTMALRKFAQLPKLQRDQCIRSFGKFSNLSEAERQEFLKNAERWRELSPAERQAWRNLVNRLPARPPLPPGLAFPPMPPNPPLQVSLPVRTNASRPE